VLPIYAENPHKVYEFSPGKYHVLDYPVNIRSQPGLHGSVIGRLELNSEIEIIENTKIEQTIGGKAHYWYRINYGNIVGYIWGGLIAVEAFAFNIDGTEIKAYFRYSYIEGRIIANDNIYYFYYPMILPDDIFIYINQRSINIDDTVIRTVYLNEYFILANSQKYYIRTDWKYCNFYEEDSHIVLLIGDRAAVGSRFTINKNGEIIYVNSEVGWL
jgi:hypothetical protein